MPAPRPEDDLLQPVIDVFNGYRGWMQQVLDEQGIAASPLDLWLMSVVAEGEGCSQQQLVQATGRDKAQVTRMAARLVQAGLLQRAPDAADGRRWRLTLTDAGKAAHRQMQRQRKRLAATLAADLSAEEQATLTRLLGRMAARLPATD